MPDKITAYRCKGCFSIFEDIESANTCEEDCKDGKNGN